MITLMMALPESVSIWGMAHCTQGTQEPHQKGCSLNQGILAFPEPIHSICEIIFQNFEKKIFVGKFYFLFYVGFIYPLSTLIL